MDADEEEEGEQTWWENREDGHFATLKIRFR
jgi:hypothetical protein